MPETSGAVAPTKEPDIAGGRKILIAAREDGYFVQGELDAVSIDQQSQPKPFVLREAQPGDLTAIVEEAAGSRPPLAEQAQIRICLQQRECEVRCVLKMKDKADPARPIAADIGVQNKVLQRSASHAGVQREHGSAFGGA